MKNIIFILAIAFISCKKKNTPAPTPVAPVQPPAATTRTVQISAIASTNGTIQINWNYDYAQTASNSYSNYAIGTVQATFNQIVPLTADSLTLNYSTAPPYQWTISVNGSTVKTGTTQGCMYKY